MKPIRSVIVSARFTLEEEEVLKDLANGSGKDKSDILRQPVIDELNRRKRRKKGVICTKEY